MTKARGFLLAVAAAAMAFTVSCTSGDGGGGSGGGGKTFADSRDGKTYKKVTIGTQTWMAENLSYNASGSKCFGEGGPAYVWDDGAGDYIEKTLSPSEAQANCATYGRLYNWETALTVCPSGWRLPSNDDWDKLLKYVDAQNGREGEGTPYGSYTAGRYLKATSGWNSNGNGTDKYGFSALPGGYGYSDGSFVNAGNLGLWWSASELNSNYAYRRRMSYYDESADWNDYYKPILFSVRCLQD